MGDRTDNAIKAIPFLVPSSRTALDPGTPEPSHRGTLADLGALLESWKGE